MELKKHKEIHKKLHSNFDKLLADYIFCIKGSGLDDTINDLLKWSFIQTKNPSEPYF